MVFRGPASAPRTVEKLRLINYYLHELYRIPLLYHAKVFATMYLLSQGRLISIGVLLSNDKYFTGAKKSSRSGEGLGDLDMGSK